MGIGPDFLGPGPPAHMPAGLGLKLVGLFEAVFPDNGLGSAKAFQTRPHLPARTDDLSQSVVIRGLGSRRAAFAPESGRTRMHDSVRVEFESSWGSERIRFLKKLSA